MSLCPKCRRRGATPGEYPGDLCRVCHNTAAFPAGPGEQPCEVCGMPHRESGIMCQACEVRLDAASQARDVPLVPEFQAVREAYAEQVKIQAGLVADPPTITRDELIEWAEAQRQAGNRHAQKILRTHTPPQTGKEKP